jgi:hypothetical protein
MKVAKQPATPAPTEPAKEGMQWRVYVGTPGFDTRSARGGAALLNQQQGYSAGFRAFEGCTRGGSPGIFG